MSHVGGNTSISNRTFTLDDLLATGGTAEAGIKLIERLGAQVIGCAFVVDLPALGGRKKLEATRLKGFAAFDQATMLELGRWLGL